MKNCVLASALLAAAAIVGCDDPVTPPGGPDCFEPAGLQGETVRDVALVGSQLIAGTTGALWRSSLGSDRWTRIWSDTVRTPFSLNASASGDLVILLTQSTKPLSADYWPEGPWDFISRDGGETWTAIEYPPEVAYRSSLVSAIIEPASGEPIVIVGTGSTLFRSSDGGWSWELVRGGTGGTWAQTFAAAISPHDGSIWLGGTTPLQYPIMVTSSDEGRTWNQIEPTKDDPRTPQFVVEDFYFDPVDPDRILTTGLGFLETLDGGLTWEWLWEGMHVSHQYGLMVEIGDRVYAFSRNPDIRDGVTPFWEVSGDGGRTWQATLLPPSTFTVVFGTAVAPDHSIALATENGIWRFNADSPTCSPTEVP